MSDTRKSFHETVAEKLIEQLKQGTAPWQKPWRAGEPGAFLPINPTTGKRYRGINAIHLMSQGQLDQRWMTYKQAANLGAQVRKGEQGTSIQYWKFNDEQTRIGADGQPVRDAQGELVREMVALERPRVFFATVFNAAQIDGLPTIQASNGQDQEQQWNPVERAEQILQASGAAIHHGEHDRAFYRPTTDSIHLPSKARFPSADNYYVTALHELGHWTGHETRLDRDLIHPFGSEGYAREELRAEIASMILGLELGIGHDPAQHAAYVGAWIKVLQDDPLEIFRAAADAEKIQGHVLGLEQRQIQSQTQRQADTVGHRLPIEADSNAEKAAHSQPAPVMTAALSPAKSFIDVPFSQKDDARTLGARWDRQQQSWYVPAGLDPAAFDKWKKEAATKAIVDPQQHADAKHQKLADERQYLAVPYGERVAAKALGARWDKAAKSWYAGPKAIMAKLERWQSASAPAQQAPAMPPKEEFAEALRFLGCVVDGEHPIMDGQKHRISVEGEQIKEKAGAGFYVGFLDGHPAGYIKNNKTGIEMKWKSKGYVLDPVQKAQMQADADARLQAREADHGKLQEQAAQRVVHKMADLVPAVQPTPYMLAKGVIPQQGVFTDKDGRTTWIPGIDVNGKQWTMQTIREDGTKRFAKDSRKEGCFHVINGMAALAKAPALVIAEGYATASSLSQALGFATVAAFDSGNLPHVAKVLHAKFPDKPVIIAGDDDRHLEATQGTNPGTTKAEEAARATGGKVLLPIFTPGEQAENPKGYTDFNDLANKSALGEEGVARQVCCAVTAIIEQHRSHAGQVLQQRHGRSPGIG
jgi:antirestriction protein ArdC/phage/plasmid primase-like uncharacterized protein